MTHATGEENGDNMLKAFADGELGIEDNLTILKRMAKDPQVLHTVIHQQKLRIAIYRTIHQNAPVAPDALRTKIQRLAAQTETSPEDLPQSDKPTSSNSKKPWLVRWISMTAAAAMLLFSAIVFLDTNTLADGPVSEARYAKFVSRHLGCSRKISELRHREQFVQNLQLLPSTLTEFLGGSLVAGLDLSSIGYEFFAIGECTVPGEKSVHLIYRHQTDQNTISLWIRKHDGVPTVKPNRPYVHTGNGMENPILLWQNGEMIYYLVGHSFGDIENAAKLLRTPS